MALLFVVFAGAILGAGIYFRSSLQARKEQVDSMRRKLSSKWAVISIGLNFIQILAVFSSIDLRWPGPVRNTLAALSVFNFNVDLLATDCSVEWTYPVKWLMAMGLPLLCCVLWILLIGVVKVMSYIPFTSSLVRVPSLDALIAAGMLLLSFGYLMLTAKALEPFDCTSAPGGRYRMDAAPHLYCFEGWWFDMLGPFIFFTLLYVIGIPVVFGWAILGHHEELLSFDSRASARYGVVTSRYLPGLGWYELAVMGRKLAVVVGQLFFASNPLGQALVIQVALLGAVAVHQRYLPYAEPELNHVESALLLCGLLVLIFGVLMFSSSSVVITWITVGVIVLAIAIVACVVVYALLYDLRGSHRVGPQRVVRMDEGSGDERRDEGEESTLPVMIQVHEGSSATLSSSSSVLSSTSSLSRASSFLDVDFGLELRERPVTSAGPRSRSQLQSGSRPRSVSPGQSENRSLRRRRRRKKKKSFSGRRTTRRRTRLKGRPQTRSITMDADDLAEVLLYSTPNVHLQSERDWSASRERTRSISNLDDYFVGEEVE